MSRTPRTLFSALRRPRLTTRGWLVLTEPSFERGTLVSQKIFTRIKSEASSKTKSESFAGLLVHCITSIAKPRTTRHSPRYILVEFCVTSQLCFSVRQKHTWHREFGTSRNQPNRVYSSRVRLIERWTETVNTGEGKMCAKGKGTR